MKTSKHLIRMFTLVNFSALTKRCLRIISVLCLFFLGTKAAYSEDWYVSNAAGMALEKTFSRAALREPYALKIEYRGQNSMPLEISVFIDSSIAVPESFNAELHTLYENAEEKNQRWVLRYAEGNTWLVISVKENGSGFAEYYDASNLLIQEDTFFDGSVIRVRHHYDDRMLMQNETWQIPRKNSEGISAADESAESAEPDTHLWSDVYHYTRNGSLRSIERLFHSAEAEDKVSLVHFVPLNPGYEDTFFRNVSPALSSDFMSDVIYVRNRNIEYVTDNRGRIISEIHKDDEGNIIGELVNTWSGDRLASIAWNGENDTRRIEYEYDGQGNRIIERNYRNGILERLVRAEEDREVEELYLQGQLSLRAVWKDGQKISEEYFRLRSGRSF